VSAVSSVPFGCPICGSAKFYQKEILWKELIEAWGLSEEERRLVDRQQGLCCGECGASLRSMTMAAAMLREFGSHRLFREFVTKDPVAERLSLIEINEAGDLTPYLSQFRHYTFARYPEVDIQALPFGDDLFDVIAHGDTLEHVPDPVLALRECRRVLSKAGRLFFTIPIVPSKLTRRRAGLASSFHGAPDQNAPDYVVCTEYGADFFTDVVAAGFRQITLHTLGDISSFCVVCGKS
jgi:SAM-dependent methyltransferase